MVRLVLRHSSVGCLDDFALGCLRGRVVELTLAPRVASISSELQVTALVVQYRGRSLKVLRFIALVYEEIGVEVAILGVLAGVRFLVDLIQSELLIVRVLASVSAQVLTTVAILFLLVPCTVRVQSFDLIK